MYRYTSNQYYSISAAVKGCNDLVDKVSQDRDRLHKTVPSGVSTFAPYDSISLYLVLSAVFTSTVDEHESIPSNAFDGRS